LKERLGVPFRVDSEAPVDVAATVVALQSPEDPVAGVELLAAVQRLSA
jgi:hypothetical protein